MAPRRQKGPDLEQYQAKRDFSVTPEPKGRSRRAGRAAADGKSEGRSFVVQRHRARRLHYDFRLELDGVLVSWALPKGPSLDPATRNLAVHVEDHPIEYRDFEGVIPKGGYGGGDVIVWDRGTWTPGSDDPAADIAKGELHFDLHGQKLQGRFLLVHTRRDTERRGQEQWLMFHKRDEYSQPGWDPEAHPQSVKSGRTNDEVAASPEAMWRGDLPPGEAEVALDVRTRPAPAETRWSGPTDDELAALDALGAKGTWEFGGRAVALTNLDKELFPGRDGGEPMTKRDLIRYYAVIAPVMLRYLVDRPVNMNRFPNGAEGKGFWHKQLPDHAPEWITRWRYEGAGPGKSESYAVVDSPPTLAWMANFAALELHPWTSRIPEVQHPTWAYIDIDPGERTSWADVVVIARLYKAALDHLGVAGLPKLTGKRGLHVWVPVADGYSFDDTRIWVEQVSRAVGGTVPDLVSWTWTKRDRKGLARLDYTQNAINKTLVAPYSVRAAPGAPVSVPIDWDDLDDPELRSDRYTIADVPGRVQRLGDRFEQLCGLAQELPPL